MRSPDQKVYETKFRLSPRRCVSLNRFQVEQLLRERMHQARERLLDQWQVDHPGEFIGNHLFTLRFTGFEKDPCDGSQVGRCELNVSS